VQWSLGDFGGAGVREAVVVSSIALIVAPLVALAGRTLNLLALGDDHALSSGVDVVRARSVFYTMAAALTAVAVASAGIIGFVGLIVPHAGRRLFGSDHRVLLPVSALLGAGVTVLADTLARSLVAWLFGLAGAVSTTVELPVGSVTAFFGAPFFLWLLVRSGRGAV
jgi:iron complex transport system permease protein